MDNTARAALWLRRTAILTDYPEIPTEKDINQGALLARIVPGIAPGPHLEVDN